MENYYITYKVTPKDSDDNGVRHTTVSEIDSDHAKDTLKKVIPNVLKIVSCVRIKRTKNTSRNYQPKVTLE